MKRKDISIGIIMSKKIEEMDIISNLPDPILHHILSFLDMKEVVCTSHLSRRWRYIWRSVSHLNFHQDLWSDTCTNNDFRIPNLSEHKFMDFVDYVLYLRDDTNVQKFLLSGSGHGMGNYQIPKWMTILINRKIPEIHLKLPEYTALPLFVFTSPTNLKILHLEYAILPQGDLNGELELKCQVLETLVLHSCYHKCLILKLFALQLKNLVLDNDREKCVDFCKIKICAPNLNSLKCKGYMYQDYFMEDLSSLVTANVGGIAGERINVQHVIKLLSGLQNAATLVITDCWLKDNESNITKNLAEYGCFNFSFRVLNIQNVEGSENELNFFKFLLENAMVLERVNITTCLSSGAGRKELDEFSKKLHSLPRASTNARIHFVIKN
ncbi:hypothetical protein AQUCO_05500014v1 [Aquilegia coerulea]|uniref:F-box domain-containing protein n=1 Tax=Aquilegia coerulea TaxID=218851 RepID=A0A2G5CGL4_AQUCA|nr:hypothetical protein AQUCO_05500014v1 [Aquilegia coerulea]PIA30446.1 hypothetical protein AQUCO_05500014v1 [Aquilegia coerulea]